MNCKSSLTFSTRRDLQEYCESHAMHPDTEWIISSTGECGRGPFGASQKKGENRKDDRGIPSCSNFHLSWYGRIMEDLGYIEETAKVLFEERRQRTDQADELIAKWSESCKANLSDSERKDSAAGFAEGIHFLAKSATTGEHDCRERILSTFGRESPCFFGNGDVTFSKAAPEIQSRRVCALDFVCRLGAKNALSRPIVKFEIGKSGTDSYCMLVDTGSNLRHLNKIVAPKEATVGIYIHELAHAIENSNPEIGGLMKNFAWKRLLGARETMQKLFERHGIARKENRYEANGKIYKTPTDISPDHYFDPYAGQRYQFDWDSERQVYSQTFWKELFSTGVSELYDHPLRFWKTDPEYFKIVLFALTQADGNA